MKNVIITSILMLTTGTLMCSEPKDVQNRLAEFAANNLIISDIHEQCVWPYFTARAENPDNKSAWSNLQKRMSTYRLPRTLPSEIKTRVNKQLPTIKAGFLREIAQDVDQRYSGLSFALRKECYAFHANKTYELCIINNCHECVFSEKNTKKRDALAAELAPEEETLVERQIIAQRALQQKIDAELSARRAATPKTETK